jgi:hypothetical protein
VEVFATDTVESMLLSLGFTGLEADIYLTLIREPGITGYRVAQILGKPVPNTYKALDTLGSKGAVLADDAGRSRTYAAVPIGEFIDNLVIGLKQTRTSLEACMADIGGHPPEEGVYRLQNVPQVYARATELLNSARHSVLVDAYHMPLARIQPAIEQAAARGLKCLVHAHKPGTEVKGCEVIESCRTSIPGEWMAVLADGREYLIAVISSDEKRVYQAVWSRNPFISPCIYQGYLNKALFYHLLLMLGTGSSPEDMQKEINRLWDLFAAEDPGSVALTELLERL